MRPGATEIFRCPQCYNYISRKKSNVGNIISEVYQSNVKQTSSKRPEIIQVTKCRKCGSIFWLRDKNIYDTIQPWVENSKYKYIHNAENLSIDDYVVALRLNLFESENEEFFLRLKLWREFNEKYGYNLLLTDTEKIRWRNNREKKYWKENLLRLIELFHKNRDDQKLKAVELYRHLGEFEKSR